MHTSFNKVIFYVKRQLIYLIFIVTLALTLTIIMPVLALQDKKIISDGEDLFNQHCIACHMNGNNIIRHSKTLKISDLSHQGIDNPQTINAIIKGGIGQMRGYVNELGEEGAKQVGEWVYVQALGSWSKE